jgi:hypothetical protein
MRLGIKLLNSSATVNQLQEISVLKIARGETADLVFQLVDLDQKGLRYIPAQGATVQISLPRNPDIIPDPGVGYGRVTIDNSINRTAGAAFADDRSIYKLPLLAADTKNLISTNIKVTVTEGASVKIATFAQAISVEDGN